MKTGNRFWALMLALGILLTLAGTAGAEVMTLSIDFRGVVEQEDGSEAEIALTGSFRVLQGGMDRGVIWAGEDTLILTGSEPVTVVPLPETIPGGWDLTDARTTVPMQNGENLILPVRVRPMKEEMVQSTPEPAPTGAEATEMPAETGKTEEADGDSPAGEQPEDAGSEKAEQPDETGSVTVISTVVAETPAPEKTQASAEKPVMEMTPVPTAAPTAEPEVSLLTATAETGTFRIMVFFDGNSNGDCGPYETGVAGIPVYLIDTLGGIVTGGKTGSDGIITLPGLTPGSYRIRVNLPEEWGFSRQAKETGLGKSVMDFSSEGVQDSAPVTVSAGETAERGVGLLKGVVADGVCWLDENANGIMESGEPKIAGAHITMHGQKNELDFEAYSDENGYWRIARLRAGFYDLTSYAPDGMMFTRYSRTGGKNRSIFTAEGKTKATRTLDLNDGKDEPDQNIGFTWTAGLSGIAFLDANYNGFYDEGEQPLAGVKVTATKQLKEEEVAVTVTGEDGRYTLSGLRGNTYRIRALLPEDGSAFTRTVEDPDGNHFAARSGRRENFWTDFVLQDGEMRTVNIGAIYYGSVSGTVYQDDDFSGTLSGNEKVSQGISVTLLDENGAAVDTKQTTAKGTYTFTGLTPGRYSLQMTAKEGYAFTRQGEGNVMLNLNGGQGYSETFEVPLGTDIKGKDAGMILPATVKGSVFADENDNGFRDAGEEGLAGTKVRLMAEEGEAFSAIISADGQFLFDAVMPGVYSLEYELPDGAIFAREGGDSVISGDSGLGRGEEFTLKTAEVKEAPLCGGLTLGRITGTFFHDADGSGTMDAGESAMAGLWVMLTPDREDLDRLEVETAADGSFELKDLHPGAYRLSLILPEGMVTSRTAKVSLPVRAGKAEQETPLEIGMGQTWEDQWIGGVVPARLAGRVWLDENNNGLADEDEQTPEGLRIRVMDDLTGGEFDTLRTDENGAFEYAGMVPGSYSLIYEMDANTDVPQEGDNTFRKAGSRMEMTGIPLAEGDSREDLTLGLVKYTALSGKVWIDRGSATEALPDAVIRLLDEAGEILQQQITGEDGAWRFAGLMPGSYRIEAELPEGTVAAEPSDERLQTGLISILAETDGRKGISGAINLVMGQDQANLNIGGVLPGTIGDYCWLDLNRNGWQDGGELGIPHVRVELVRNGETVSETETDQYGLYYFREVYPAVYHLRVTAPGEVYPTQKRTDIYLIVSSLNETEEVTAETDEFQVVSDSTDFNIDLGYVLRDPEDYPDGYGEQETMDWSRAYDGQYQNTK